MWTVGYKRYHSLEYENKCVNLFVMTAGCHECVFINSNISQSGVRACCKVCVQFLTYSSSCQIPLTIRVFKLVKCNFRLRVRWDVVLLLHGNAGYRLVSSNNGNKFPCQTSDLE